MRDKYWENRERERIGERYIYREIERQRDI